jgi:hypothetical protein
MVGGFAPRFAVEAGFLVLLGVGAGIADLRPIVIVAVLAAGWLLVSLIELAMWRLQSRPAVPFVLPPPAEIEPEPEPEPGWPVEAQQSESELVYPLRADAGSEPSEEIEAYTRVLGGEGDDSPGERED